MGLKLVRSVCQITAEDSKIESLLQKSQIGDLTAVSNLEELMGQYRPGAPAVPAKSRD